MRTWIIISTSGTLRRLRRDATVVTAASTADLIARCGVHDVVEMGWGESRRLDTRHGDLSIDAFRVQALGCADATRCPPRLQRYVVERHGRASASPATRARTSFAAVGRKPIERDGLADRRLQSVGLPVTAPPSRPWRWPTRRARGSSSPCIIRRSVSAGSRWTNRLNGSGRRAGDGPGLPSRAVPGQPRHRAGGRHAVVAGHGRRPVPTSLTRALPSGATIQSSAVLRAATVGDPCSGPYRSQAAARHDRGGRAACDLWLLGLRIAANVRQRRAESAVLSALGVSQRSGGRTTVPGKAAAVGPRRRGSACSRHGARPGAGARGHAQPHRARPPVRRRSRCSTCRRRSARGRGRRTSALAAALVVFRRPDPAAELRGAEEA